MDNMIASTGSVSGSWRRTDPEPGQFGATLERVSTQDWSAGTVNARGFGFSIPSNATIQGIEPRIQHSGWNGNQGQVFAGNVQILHGSSVSPGQSHRDFPIDNTWRWHSFGGPTSLWQVNWTPAMINSSNFGVRLSHRFAQRNLQHYMNRFRIRVYYTVPPSHFTLQVAESDVYVDSNNLALGVNKTLSTHPSVNGLHSDNLTIASELDVADTVIGHEAQNVHVSGAEFLGVHSASHGLADTATLLKQGHVLSILNGNHSARSTGLLDLIYSTLLGRPDDASHKLLSPQFGLSQNRTLEPTNTFHRLKDERARIMNLTEMGLGSGQYKKTFSSAGDLGYLVNYIFESEDEIFIFEDEQGYGVLVPEYQRRTLLHRKTYKPSGVLGVIIDTLFESEDSMFYFESEDEKVLIGPEEGKAPQAFKKNYKQKGTF